MNVGPAEIIVVLVIALLVFGPKRLPQMGRQLGRGVREFKNAAATARTELGLDDVLSQVNDVKNDVTSVARPRRAQGGHRRRQVEHGRR